MMSSYYSPEESFFDCKAQLTCYERTAKMCRHPVQPVVEVDFQVLQNRYPQSNSMLLLFRSSHFASHDRRNTSSASSFAAEVLCRHGTVM